MKFISLFSSLLCASTALAKNILIRREPVHGPRGAPIVEKHVAGEAFKNPELQERAQSHFLNEKSKAFAVDGTKIPEVDYDVGESYAGLLPISNHANETRKLFFWFFPAAQNEVPEEVTIWLNGGPGCSSLLGFLTENGPFSWKDGTSAPVQNVYSWHNLTNMLWIEQPVGTGYAQGEPNINDEVELADQFLGFYKNFVDLFELYNWKTYLTGESYAGLYVPYIADAMLSAKDKKYFNIAGISMNNPLIGDSTIQEQIVQLPFFRFWEKLLFLNDTFMEETEKLNKDCGYTDYYEKYFRFPPPYGPFPELPQPSALNNYSCNLYYNLKSAASTVNGCFNVYHITDMCPYLKSELGTDFQGGLAQRGSEIYFNRTDVKLALHADPNTDWVQCSVKEVFPNGDKSLPPQKSGVLQRVVEALNNTIIGSGDLDMILPTNGTLFALQNMTWNGAQGFSRYPSNSLFIPLYYETTTASVGGDYQQGYWNEERGITFYSARIAGHELPGYAPTVGFRMLQVLLGRIKSFDSLDQFPYPQYGAAASSPSLGA
ncbi:hypothetical protein EKO04_011557 [Ascochyta lentis]|uniref:Carboxypeptidase n=1 Tax=Ascochyta lentis TaxID=205686 RepID=A0A8H7ITF3_9PLEO|nr:hypothetical protein EKO04_011557 [Ascochyta lentis]